MSSGVSASCLDGNCALAGFISATNPAIQATLAGIGVKRGTAELHPTLRYDEATGQLAADHTNPLQARVYGAIPQAQIGTALLGANSDFKDQMARDPWTAYRSLMAAGGIPLLWRGLNIPQEQAKAEVAREKSAKSVLAAAQKSGDWSEALQYPTLAAYYQQIQTLSPGQLAPFQARPDESVQLVGAVQGTGGTAAVLKGPPIPAGTLGPAINRAATNGHVSLASNQPRPRHRSQRMLGHASAAMTLDRYGHLMPGQAEAVADRMDALMMAVTA